MIFSAHSFAHTRRRSVAICASLAAAAIFMCVAGINLSSQGLYYDELHQATGTFAYIGKPPSNFSSFTVYNIPVLNMRYSGAIKTAIYGLYLKISTARFTVKSWRILGILFVSMGIIIFSLFASESLPAWGCLMFFMFFLTDVNMLLSTRHDYGPVALSLMLRLTIITLWIYLQIKQPARHRIIAFCIGFLTGFAIFEKLSSIVLLFPLFFFIAMDKPRITFRRLKAYCAGFLTGVLPLFLINLYTYATTSSLISLEDVQQQDKYFRLIDYAFHYLTLGNGSIVEETILGTGDIESAYYSIGNAVELLFIFLLMILSICAIKRYYYQNTYFRLSLACWLSYFSIGIGLHLLPNATSIHHWILGTPFHYIAIVLSLIGICHLPSPPWSGTSIYRGFFIISVLFFFVFRITTLVSVEQSLIQGKASPKWSPELTRMGLFASRKQDVAAFVAADWGVATQIICLSNGNPNLVYELYADYKGPQQLRNVIHNSGKKIFYLVHPVPLSGVNLNNSGRIIEDISHLNELNEVSVETSMENLKTLRIRKFILSSHYNQ